MIAVFQWGGFVTLAAIVAAVTLGFNIWKHQSDRKHAAASAIKTRRKEFLQFMAQFKSEIAHHFDGHGLGVNFNEKIPKLLYAAEAIRGDLNGTISERFETLVKEFGNPRLNRIARETVLQAIYELISGIDIETKS